MNAIQSLLRYVVLSVAVVGILISAAETAVVDGLVGHWTFDNGADLGADASGNANNGTVLVGVTPATGPIGAGAAAFNGLGSGSGYISVPDSASLDTAAGAGLDRSLAFWFKTTTDQNRVVFEKGANQHYVVQTESVTTPPGKISWRVDGANPTRVISANRVDDDAWHHYAATYTGTGNQMELFIDGASQGTNVQASAGANNSPLVIGARDGGSFGFPGGMDDVAVWNRRLSGEEVLAIVAAGREGQGLAAASPKTSTALTSYTWAMIKDNPRFYWSFNEPGLTDAAVDHVRGQANDQFVAQGDAQRSVGFTANLDTAARLDGNDAFMASNMADNNPAANGMPGAWAVEMWVKADGALGGSRGDYLLHARGAPGNNNPAFIYDFGLGGDNKIELYAGSGRTGGGGPSVDDNQWHHLVATFYGNGAGFGVADRVDMAIDGVVTTVPRGGFSAGIDFQLGAWQELILGAGYGDGSANGFQGQIDEVALYDLSGMTEAQVAAKTTRIAGHFQLASQSSNTILSYVEGATYQIDPGTPTGGGAYADPVETKLTDGVIGSTAWAQWGTGEWVGWANVDPVITFDLGEVRALDALLVDYLVGHAAGVHAPDSVLVEFSLDGSDFSAISSILNTDFNDFDPTPTVANSWNRRGIVDLEGTLARYARLTFANDMEWTFLGEVQFIQGVPEPGTVTLLVLGGLLVLPLARRRRKR